MSGPHPQYSTDPDRFARGGCVHGVDWAGTCYRCRTNSSQPEHVEPVQLPAQRAAGVDRGRVSS